MKNRKSVLCFSVSALLLMQADYDKSILKKPEEKVVTSRTLSSTEAAASIFWEVKDNCQPENRTTCEPNQCCVKEILAYLPDYKGKRAAFRLMCRNLLTEGEFCIPNDADHICPCMDGLRCRAPADLDYGHCTKI